MKLPSRKTITAIIFFGFFIIFFAALFWYFVWPFLNSGSTEYDDGTGERRPFSFFPFGRGLEGTERPNEGVDGDGSEIGEDLNNNGIPDDQEGDGLTEDIIDRFRQVTFVPTAGAILFREEQTGVSIFEQDEGPRTVIRYMESETGHVYDAFAESLAINRISNTTIPRIQEALWIDFDSVVVRYNDQATDRLKTFSANLSAREAVAGSQASGSRLTGTFLPDDIEYVSINSRQELIYTDNDTIPGSFSLIKTDSYGQDRSAIYASPLTEWKPDWAGRTNQVTLTQYPSAVSYGLTLLLNSDTQAALPYLSGRRGLDVLMSPDGKKSLVSYKTDLGVSLFVKQVNGRLDYTGYETYAEKCVWSSDNILVYCAVPEFIGNNAPDDWYQGLEIHVDDFVRINTTDMTSRDVFSPFTEKQEFLDAVDIKLSADEKYLYFRDRINQYLWLYILEL